MITELLVATVLILVISHWYVSRVSNDLELREPYAALFFEQAERLMMRKPPEVVENILLSLGACIVGRDAAKVVSGMLDDDAPLSEEAEAKRVAVEEFVRRDEDTHRIFFEAVNSALLAVSYSSLYYGPTIRKRVAAVAVAPERRKENIAITLEERAPADFGAVQLLPA